MTRINSNPTAERPHAEHSPSAFTYKEICPGFRSDPAPSEASEEGIRA